MKLILTDVEKSLLNLGSEDLIIENNNKVNNCIGCFGCWIKTPGKCVINDGYGEMGKNLGRCTDLIIISQCVYGSVSPFIKNIIDRSISYVHPNFCIRNGEMHHKRRYSNVINISAYFYGDNIIESEMKTADKLIKAIAVNFDAVTGKIIFLRNKNELEGIKL